MTLKNKIFSRMNPPVFFGAASVVVLFVFTGSFFSEWSEGLFKSARDGISNIFGWYYMLGATLFLLFALWLMFGRFGDIRLGKPEDRPEFSYLAWFTMLFSAGMGIGLVFWSVAEPISHYANPPMAEGQSNEAVTEALRFTFFHWGLHPWAIYLVLAVSLAYFHFRHGLPLAPRSILFPLIGERYKGWAGHIADILCAVGTLLGVATSLGLGAMQVNTGIDSFTGVGFSTENQIIIIALVTLIATISVVLGIHGGIRRLSVFNIALAGLFMLLILLLGPSIYILDFFVSGFGEYLQHLPSMSLWVDIRSDSGWQANWTLFYWGWWISWSPFVGIFIARISKGRTIRELVMGTLLVPVLVTFFWLSTFGGTALHMEHFENAGAILAAVDEDFALALHTMLDRMPLANVTLVVATLLIVIFFVTSSDSGSLVIDMITSGGHPNPPRAQRVFWAVSEGAVAAVLLVAGGLTAIQNAAISAGLPMSVLLVIAVWGLTQALYRDKAQESIEPEDG